MLFDASPNLMRWTTSMESFRVFLISAMGPSLKNGNLLVSILIISVFVLLLTLHTSVQSPTSADGSVESSATRSSFSTAFRKESFALESTRITPYCSFKSVDNFNNSPLANAVDWSTLTASSKFLVVACSVATVRGCVCCDGDGENEKATLLQRAMQSRTVSFVIVVILSWMCVCISSRKLLVLQLLRLFRLVLSFLFSLDDCCVLGVDTGSI
mmetsp:Transcript_35315/g.39380  ORF Transcript_35315/g.39380 Transcript_35315/m.39380 type:complete len:213 (-) Transcript_35315:61-699(-)